MTDPTNLAHVIGDTLAACADNDTREITIRTHPTHGFHLEIRDTHNPDEQRTTTMSLCPDLLHRHRADVLAAALAALTHQHDNPHVSSPQPTGRDQP